MSQNTIIGPAFVVSTGVATDGTGPASVGFDRLDHRWPAGEKR